MTRKKKRKLAGTLRRSREEVARLYGLLFLELLRDPEFATYFKTHWRIRPVVDHEAKTVNLAVERINPSAAGPAAERDRLARTDSDPPRPL